MRARLAPGLLTALLAASAAVLASPTPAARPKATRTPAPLHPGAPGGPTDFSGTWELDTKLSQTNASNFEGAALEVTQKGDHIWIQPLGRARDRVLAEEVVVDGRTYEKSVGDKEGRKGTLTAKWGTDAKSLWLEVAAGSAENPREAIQRSVWRLSSDRNTWVRETVTVSHGTARSSRLVFRRMDPRRVTP